MRINNGQLRFSATDLAKYLECWHLTSLDLLAVRGQIDKPHWHDPAVAILEERGLQHEAAYLAHLQDLGYDVAGGAMDGADRTPRETECAMRAGAQVIFHSVSSGTDARFRAYHESNLALRAAEARGPIVVVNSASASGELNCASGVVVPFEYARALPRKGEAIETVEFTPRGA